MKRLLPLLLVANVVLLLVVPVAFAFYVRHMVDEEYATGARGGSDGDSIVIPIGGMFLLMLITAVSMNLLAGGLYLWRRRWRRLP